MCPQPNFKPVSIYKPSLTQKVTFFYRKWSAFHMLWLVTDQLEHDIRQLSEGKITVKVS